VLIPLLALSFLMSRGTGSEAQHVDPSYGQAVIQYREGNIDSAIAGLATLDRSHIVEGMNQFWQATRKLSEQRIGLMRAAVLLHTETWFRRAYLSWPGSADVHMECARTLLRRLETLGDDRAFVRDWYLLVTSFLHNGREMATSRLLLEDARKEFPNDGLILLASGIDHEILSAVISVSPMLVERGRELVAGQPDVGKELEDAAKYFRATLAAGSESVAAQEARLRLGRALYRRRDLEASERELSTTYASAERSR
jgi:hypothetical protein